jgi:hypothetical protein
MCLPGLVAHSFLPTKAFEGDLLSGLGKLSAGDRFVAMEGARKISIVPFKWLFAPYVGGIRLKNP